MRYCMAYYPPSCRCLSSVPFLRALSPLQKQRRLLVVYALILGVVLYRNIKLVNLPGIFARAMRDSAVIMVIMGAVAAANWVLTFERVPNMLTEWALMSIDTQWTSSLPSFFCCWWLGSFWKVLPLF